MTSATQSHHRTATSSKRPASSETRPPDQIAEGAESSAPSSDELASSLGTRGARVVEDHHHSPGGHGPDVEGSETIDAAGDLHSDDRDIDDNDDALEAAVESRADIEDIANEDEGTDEAIEESERSFLEEPVRSAKPLHLV
jgi:hypothetical protein